MARVFVVQQPAVYDRAKGSFVPKLDLSPAERFGELVFLLPPGNVRKEGVIHAEFSAETILRGFTAEDYLLPLGDPVAMTLAALALKDVAAYTITKVKVLKWDKHRTTYSVFELRLGAAGPAPKGPNTSAGQESDK